MSHVFIAYSREDAGTMKMLRSRLRSKGVAVWTDEELKRTDHHWMDSIEDALDGACCLVALFSPTAKRSRWVIGELDYAEDLPLPVFCVLVAGSRKESVPINWRVGNIEDIRGKRGATWNEPAVDSLVQDIRSTCASK